MENLINDIKRHEGFSGMPYDDNRGLPTIGYGTLLPISEFEGELLLKHRLDLIIQELYNHKPFMQELPEEAQEILLNMAYNLGVPRLMKFKKMWKALESGDFIEASKEMKDSRWYRQVGKRAEELVERMSNVSY